MTYSSDKKWQFDTRFVTFLKFSGRMAGYYCAPKAVISSLLTQIKKGLVTVKDAFANYGTDVIYASIDIAA